jgi:hypothetical protein
MTCIGARFTVALPWPTIIAQLRMSAAVAVAEGEGTISY